MTIEAYKLALIHRILALQDARQLKSLEQWLQKDAAAQPAPKTKINGKNNPRQFGCGKGIFTYVAPDFDDTPPGFEEYVPANAR
jgi:hypothetical protein